MVRSGRWIGGLEAEYHLVCLGLPRHRVRWCQYQSFSDWTAIPAGGHRGRLLRESAYVALPRHSNLATAWCLALHELLVP